MKAVIQRVEDATLRVGAELVAEIGRGLVVYVGIEQNDTESDAVAMCKKIAAMRIFTDDADKMNLSAADIGGDILMVSNFTLCADISHGNRPSFTAAMRPPASSELFDYCVDFMRGLLPATNGKTRVKSGIFGADMLISQTNTGPVTIIY